MRNEMQQRKHKPQVAGHSEGEKQTNKQTSKQTSDGARRGIGDAGWWMADGGGKA